MPYLECQKSVCILDHHSRIDVCILPNAAVYTGVCELELSSVHVLSASLKAHLLVHLHHLSYGGTVSQ